MLCTHSTEKLLGLQGVHVKKVTQGEETTIIEIILKKQKQHCRNCGAAVGTVHDYRKQTVKDIPAFGKHTVLILQKRRYRCTDCGKRFQEYNSFLPK